MIEANLIPGSLHAQPLLKAVMVVALTALVKFSAGTHISSTS
jgi:hypothetical protein